MSRSSNNAGTLPAFQNPDGSGMVAVPPISNAAPATAATTSIFVACCVQLGSIVGSPSNFYLDDNFTRQIPAGVEEFRSIAAGSSLEDFGKFFNLFLNTAIQRDLDWKEVDFQNPFFKVVMETLFNKLGLPSASDGNLQNAYHVIGHSYVSFQVTVREERRRWERRHNGSAVGNPYVIDTRWRQGIAGEWECIFQSLSLLENANSAAETPASRALLCILYQEISAENPTSINAESLVQDGDAYIRLGDDNEIPNNHPASLTNLERLFKHFEKISHARKGQIFQNFFKRIDDHFEAIFWHTELERTVLGQLFFNQMVQEIRAVDWRKIWHGKGYTSCFSAKQRLGIQAVAYITVLALSIASIFPSTGISAPALSFYGGVICSFLFTMELRFHLSRPSGMYTLFRKKWDSPILKWAYSGNLAVRMSFYFVRDVLFATVFVLSAYFLSRSYLGEASADAPKIFAYVLTGLAGFAVTWSAMLDPRMPGGSEASLYGRSAGWDFPRREEAENARPIPLYDALMVMWVNNSSAHDNRSNNRGPHFEWA